MQQVVTSSSTATLLVEGGSVRSRSVIIQNRAGGDVYIGDDTVTADDAVTGGHLISDAGTFGLLVPPGVSLYVIGADGPVSVLVAE